MRLIAAIHTPEATQKILDCLGLPSRAPPMASAVPRTRLFTSTSSKNRKTLRVGHVCAFLYVSAYFLRARRFRGTSDIGRTGFGISGLPSLIQPCSPRAFRMDVLLGQNGNGFGFDHQLFAGQFSDLYQCASRGILAVVLARMSRSAFSRPHGTHLDSVKIGEIHPCSELR
jgi:hypothetical protein